MRILTVILLLLSLNVQAETLYSSVDDYLKTVTGVSEVQSNHIKERIDGEYYNPAVSKNKKWYVGSWPGGTSESVFLYLLEATPQGKLRLVAKVNTKEEMRYPYDFEQFAFDGNDNFSFSVQLIQSGHTTETYFFRLIKKQWFLVRVDRSELAQCGEGENALVSDSLEMSTNYLTGQVKEQRYSEKDCKPLKLVKKKQKFSLVPISDFYPFMQIEPKE